MDDWDYLERQMEGGAPAEAPAPEAAAVNGSGARDDREERGKEGREERRKERRRSRSRSRDKGDKGERRRDRDDRDRRGDDRERRGDDRDRRDRGRARSPPPRERDNYDPRGRRENYDNRRRDREQREKTPPEVRAAKEAEKELREMERSTRTALAYNLNLRAGEREIYQLFSKVGKIVDIKLITDKNTKRSKGFAYVEFSRVEEVLAAVALTGTVFQGQAIMVKSSEHEKNLAWEAQQQAKQSQLKAAALLGQAGVGASGEALPVGPCKLYVANLNAAIAEADVSQLFAPFGQLEGVQLVRDPTGKSQGYGYVTFSNVLDATKALEHWNGRAVAGAALKVSVSSVSASPAVAAATAAAAAGALPLGGGLLGAAGLGALGGLGAVAGGLPALTLPADFASRFGLAAPGAAAGLAGVQGAAAAAAAAAAATGPESGIGELDEEESRGGLKLTSDRRQALMARLATSAGMAPVAPTLPGMALPGAAPVPAGPKLDPGLSLIQSVLGPASPIPTPCLLIKNMFEPASAEAEMGASWPEEIAQDVQEECGKYGAVAHIHVDRNSKFHCRCRRRGAAPRPHSSCRALPVLGSERGASRECCAPTPAQVAAAGQGCVYLKFGSTEAACAAQAAMNGRWFAGRQLGVEFQFAQPYASHFAC